MMASEPVRGGWFVLLKAATAVPIAVASQMWSRWPSVTGHDRALAFADLQLDGGDHDAVGVDAVDVAGQFLAGGVAGLVDQVGVAGHLLVAGPAA
jgi:hypothetical protein